MDNKKIAKIFRRYAQLMELHGENPFRTKAMAAAAFKLDKLSFIITPQTISKLSEVPGIGQRTADKVNTLLASGSFPELEALINATPEGILEMLTIKGLGPKKIKVIWRDLDIESIGELYYACNENRLVGANGFGLKTQLEIKQALEFSIANKGWFLYANAESMAESVMVSVQELLPRGRKIAFTGDFRRKCEVLQSIDLIAEASFDELTAAVTKIDTLLVEIPNAPAPLLAKNETGLTFRFIPSDADSFSRQLLITTGSDEHLRLLDELLPEPQLPDFESEEAIYASLGLSYIEPELREGNNEIVLATTGALPILINYTDLRGTLHNHSTYSDGVNTLEEMARYCRDELRLEYLGICDHSRAAVYAKGLDIGRVQEQWAEIDALNVNLAPFRIFKGIESDILGDGSLDYPDEILAGFDFVVASIHSNLKMDKERATNRLVKAIENPYTTLIGHPTGRLLLSRTGYQLDYERIIDTCAAHGVAIEINANPLRLDLDWRWHRYAIEKGVMLSINPDAHRNNGFRDMQYGVHVARKGGVAAQHCLNTLSVEAIAEYFNQQKQRKVTSF
ncbi:MAG TPA: helix-hairpin-helix domain-containing protein [Parapedobacter sp.]|uniref:helix-hairpin-helix domain-containing protein n=1 Tax=Parapedobacter sp. TaxID=1958893 RepID=UPI002BAD4A3D|nr:helix-hairpin-helix domain-containing protein [Parapedobacter sp.]HWK58218.1 helix-hairpin-helix domain-containing protein [Parapedobacter sp.]